MMKIMKLTNSLLAFFMVCFTVTLSAQSDAGQKEISVSVEVENGLKNTTLSIKSSNGQEKQFQWEGDEIPIDIKNELDDLKIDIETIEQEGKTTTIEQRIVQESPGSDQQKEIQVIIKSKDGEKVMEWQGTDEMPAEIRAKVDALQGLHGEHSNGNKIVIRSGDGEEKVFEWTGEEIPAEIKEQLNESELNEITKVEATKGNSGKGFLGIAMAMTIEKTMDKEVETSSQRIEIADVIEGSGAEKAGLKIGDEILAVNGTTVTEPDQIVNILNSFKPGDIVPVKVKREQQELTLNVTLTEANPASVNQKKTIVIEKDIKNDGTYNVVPKSNELKLQELTIHPNPAGDVINIAIKGNQGPLSISISDIEGKTILQKEVKDFNGSYQDELDVHSFPKGALIIQIEQNGKSHTEKVIRQ